MTPHALFFFQINDFINQIDMPNEKNYSNDFNQGVLTLLA
jgi:hypothetical protein